MKAMDRVLGPNAGSLFTPEHGLYTGVDDFIGSAVTKAKVARSGHLKVCRQSRAGAGAKASVPGPLGLLSAQPAALDRATNLQRRPELVFKPTRVAGCYEIVIPAHSDARGTFVKPFDSASFAAQGLAVNFVESFHSVSNENVIRGMHLQLSPADQAKLVYCVSGAVHDVVLDLRLDSSSFGQFVEIELSTDRHNAIYVPPGTAHGFCVQQGPAIMVYHVTKDYIPKLDSGVRWNSFGASWPVTNPIISERDAELPDLHSFLAAV